MSQWIFGIIYFALIAAFVYGIYRKYRKRQLHYEIYDDKQNTKEEGGKVVKMEVAVPDSWVFVKYRGMVLPMREIEKTEIWDNMTRKGRNEQVDAMKKAIKAGKVRAVQLDSETVCYIPLAGNLQKMRDDYNEFKKLGGKIIEEE